MATSEEFYIFGDTTRQLWKLFSSHAGSRGVLIQTQIRHVLNEIRLFPSKSQIYELVHAACECSGRTPVDHVTFGEFCLLVTELQEHYRRCPVPPQPRSQLKDRAAIALEERRKRRRLSGHAGSFKVFLGGSCNPTTWRHDVAIPHLKENKITFYNPQVSNWKPELIEIEDQAKQSAELLFFVIDNQTRSTASMVEAAYLAGCGRQLILVIRSFDGPVTICNETLSDVEVEDLERSHAFLTDLVERKGIPVFCDINVALNCTTKSIQQGVKVTHLSLDDGAEPVKYPHIRVADKFMKLRDIFTAVDTTNSGRLSYVDVNLAYRTITDEDLPLHTSSGLSDTTFTFEDFCCLVAEFGHKRKSALRRILSSISRLPGRMFDWFRGQGVDCEISCESGRRKRDVFLGGTCGKSSWRDDIAIPILRKYGISYFNPQLPEWSTRYIPLEAAVKDSCRLLLYVVSADTRGITSMLEVGHYVGNGCNVILCIEYLHEGDEIEGEVLTSTAVKDYNRARTYLADLANRDGIPVFDNVEEAVSSTVQRLRMDIS